MKISIKLGAIAVTVLGLIGSALARPVGSNGKVLQIYYADWTGMPVSAIPFNKVTHVNYAFASLRQDHLPRFDLNGNGTNLSTTPGPKLQALVKAGHAANTKVHLSIGGWAGSTYFSPMAADTSAGGKRDQFIAAVKSLVVKYHLDGIDIDWEEPGMPDASQTCTKSDPGDYEAYVSLLSKLKSTLGSGVKLTIAGHLGGIKQAIWNCRDLSSSWAVQECTMDGLAKALDWVYDFGGPWNTFTGPNAPLVSPGANTQASFKFGVKDSVERWITLGVPANQLVVGLPFYARSTTTTASMAGLSSNNQYVGQEANDPPKGDSGDALDPDQCDGAAYNHYSGVWKWKNLRSQGVLTSTTKASSAWKQHWDSDTFTNWLWNPKTNVYLSYDNPLSLTYKVDYLRCAGVKGVMAWEISQDNGELLAVVQGIYNSAQKSTCSVGASSPGSNSSLPTNA
ncbi:glycoside hydrolase superfamily [Endogone sp. FLAS-F59071]|nr:glycoside hydrolase superfamily [Endogone sp. FLAS-F59071]|eukprot:RUS14639.1 glycoside hydrolase superfamily [Endogone sp. FLAS-F59071]